MQAKLVSIDGDRPILLSKDVTVVGRKRGTCDVYIDRSSVSKLHCVIVKTDGLLFIRDLGSTNGTKVNGQRVVRGALLPGDELAFANARYRVHLGPDEGRSDDDTSNHTEVMDSADRGGRRRESFRADDDDDDDRHHGSNSESDVRLIDDSAG
jgi:predicted component of type VI protein secretion system